MNFNGRASIASLKFAALPRLARRLEFDRLVDPGSILRVEFARAWSFEDAFFRRARSRPTPLVWPLPVRSFAYCPLRLPLAWRVRGLRSRPPLQTAGAISVALNSWLPFMVVWV